MSNLAQATPTRGLFPPLLHYTDEHGLDVLFRRELKITPPGEFNDPFEFRLTLPTKFTLEQIKTLYLGKYSLLRRIQEDRFGTPTADYDRCLVNLPDPNTKEGGELYAEQFRELRRISISSEGLDAIFGIACFSEKSSAPTLADQRAQMLMWAHYAKKHRGLLIEFDFNQSGPPHDLATDDHLWKIEGYAERPPEMALDDFADIRSKAQARVLRRWGSVKAEAWSYEREWRLVAPLNNAEQGTTSRLVDGRLLHFISLGPLNGKPSTLWQEHAPILAVRRVVLGCKISPTLKHDVLSLLEAPAYRHVHIQEMELLERDYGLENKTLREPRSY